LDKSLFIGFVTYVLARAGYCNKTICEKWQLSAKIYEDEFAGCLHCDINPVGVRSSESAIMKWPSLIHASFAWAEEVNDLWDKFGEPIEHAIFDLLSVMGTWSHYFENSAIKSRIKVIFTEYLPLDRFEDSKDIKNWETLSAIDPSCSNLILVTPWAFKVARRKNEKLLKDICQLLLNENIALLSVDEFFDKFVSRAEKETEAKNWLAIRKETLEDLIRSNPILVISLEWERLNEVELYLKTARKEYENAKDEMDLKHAVRDATYAIEALLKILYHKHFGKEAPSDQQGTWEPLQNKLQDTIKEELGDIVYSDLKFLQDWRNYENHPNPSALTKNIVFQVINRSEAFYESLKTTLNRFKLPLA